ncbi:MAG TPA: tetrahydromethanopterin S-methyltransferase subunit G [Methanocella sp.]|nr:tetrahydromethanopterin S-methyltransferase subunit G [Methanocella sp.]
MVSYLKLLPEYKLSYGIETGKIEHETKGKAPLASGPIGPIIDPKDYTAAIRRIDGIEEKVEFVVAEIHQTEGKRLGREIGILYGMLFGALIYIAYSVFIQLGIF